MAGRCPQAYLTWSGGKDSTAMVLLASRLGVVRVMSVKDDLDFPGEREYVEVLAEQWGVALDIVEPTVSLQALLSETFAGDDIHGRGAKLSKAGFYPLVERYAAERGYPGIYLGLRASESRGRAMNAHCRGAIYKKKSGEVVCQPLWDWSDMDVYGYLFANDIPLLPLYKCTKFAERPGRIRKSWWAPGAAARKGQTVWLKFYYPSLFQRLTELVPGSSAQA